jgi:hypothetical protein
MPLEALAVSRRAARAGLWLVCLGAGACEPSITSVGSWTDAGHYLEAESGALSGGFEVGLDSAASNGQYIAPPVGVFSGDSTQGAARAVYELTIVTSGSYRIWGRIRSPTTNSNRFWVRVDDGAWIKWRITVGDIWYWDAFHNDTDYTNPLEFPLTAGTHQLTIANWVPGVNLDRLYYTPDPLDKPPGNDTPCRPPDSIELNGACQPSCGSQGGNQCSIPTCQGLPLLTAYDCAVCCKK